MATIQQITIPEPCTQQWNQMTPKSTGRHCVSCDKTVVDFTLMTSQEIIGYLGKSGNVCGRICVPQFESVNRQLAYNNQGNTRGWKKWVIAASVLAATMFNKAVAQSDKSSTPTTEQAPLKYVTLGKIAMPVNPQQSIEGKVVDDSNEPVPGAKVTVKGTNLSVLTATNGTFRISMPATATVIKVEFIGYQSIEVSIGDKKGKVKKIKLMPVSSMLGGMGVIYSKPTLMKQLYSRLISKHKAKFFS